MPIYEFYCENCQCRFEELVSFAAIEKDGVRCPDCDSSEVNRLISAFSFSSLNGGGAASLGKGCGPCTKSSCSGCGSS